MCNFHLCSWCRLSHNSLAPVFSVSVYGVGVLSLWVVLKIRFNQCLEKSSFFIITNFAVIHIEAMSTRYFMLLQEDVCVEKTCLTRKGKFSIDKLATCVSGTILKISKSWFWFFHTYLAFYTVETIEPCFSKGNNLRMWHLKNKVFKP